jgi:hypothetical protein
MAALICENAILARHLAKAQARCLPAPAAAPSATTPETSPLRTADGRPRRRKLHELPAQAQDLLLAMSFQPATLRAELEKALSRLRGQPVQLNGTEADLLYSALHDLNRRNELSDALHRRLEARHTAAVRRLAPLREAEALRQVWLDGLQRSARPHEDIPALLWALLTHPQGAALEVQALAEARTWVFAQARRGQAAADIATARQLQALQAEVQALKQRLQREQATHAQEKQALQRQAAALVGEARRAATTERPAAPAWVPMHPPLSRQAAAPAPPRPSPPQAAQAPSTAAPTAEPAPPARRPAGSPVQGRRVLCVGGIQHAVARYRSRVETLGGRFEHHDGGIHDNAHALDGRLARADLVICQAGCINHAAYHRIKQHCQRTGTPCVYLERASLSRFDRALQDLQTAVSRAGENPSP